VCGNPDEQGGTIAEEGPYFNAGNTKTMVKIA
jgi:hypothetical protein